MTGCTDIKKVASGVQTKKATKHIKLCEFYHIN